MRFKVFDLGLLDYKQAWDFQRETFLSVRNGSLDSALILCRHYPAITMSRMSNRQNILLSEQELNNKGISLHTIERGGDVTYHGPGQITLYPVFNLEYFKKDIHWFLNNLEEVAIKALGLAGIKSGRSPGRTGAWVGNKKIASVGIAIKNWVTFHGLTINVSRHDLSNFSFIRPCGMDIEMTCAEKLLNRPVDISRLEKTVVESAFNTFNILKKEMAS